MPGAADVCPNRKKTMNRRSFSHVVGVCLAGVLLAAGTVAGAVEEAPDALIKRTSTEVLDTIKADKAIQSGDTGKIIALVDAKVMPHVNFTRMTAATVGRNWRQATPEQQKRLQEEFKTLLVRTYSGALAQVKDQTVNVKPLRAASTDSEVIVRTEVIGRSEPIQLDYRMEKTPAGWKIYDLNVLGIWMVETYRTQFAQEISTKGVDGLIAALSQRNKSNAGDKKS